jgi:hypothetical protein
MVYFVSKQKQVVVVVAVTTLTCIWRIGYSFHNCWATRLVVNFIFCRKIPGFLHTLGKGVEKH